MGLNVYQLLRRLCSQGYVKKEVLFAWTTKCEEVARELTLLQQPCHQTTDRSSYIGNGAPFIE